MVHQDRLGKDLTEYHIEHGAAGKTKAQRQTQGADLTNQITQQRTQNGGNAGRSGDQYRFPLAHTAGNQGYGYSHTFRDIVQTDQNGQHQRGAAHHTFVAGIGRTDGHALGYIVQGNGAGHHDTGNEQGELIAAGITMPSLAEALQKCNGEIFPFGWWHLLKAMYLKKPETLDLLLIGVRPDYKNKGVPSIVMCDLLETCNKLGFKYAETNANLENNTAVQALWTIFEREQHKKRWVFGKEI